MNNLEEYPILDDYYYILKNLGKGATSKVKLVQDNLDNLFAVKILTKKEMSENDVKYFANEIKILKTFNPFFQFYIYFTKKHHEPSL
jgi:serine/threonine protein kinase